MQDYIHVKFDERNLFKDLFLADSCKNKNGTINLPEISRKTVRAVNAIKIEINTFINIEDYNPYEA